MAICSVHNCSAITHSTPVKSAQAHPINISSPSNNSVESVTEDETEPGIEIMSVVLYECGIPSISYSGRNSDDDDDDIGNGSDDIPNNQLGLPEYQHYHRDVLGAGVYGGMY
jgi:hypothetical protein